MRMLSRTPGPAEAGGHFPSLETPEYFVKDLQAGMTALLATHGR